MPSDSGNEGRECPLGLRGCEEGGAAMDARKKESHRDYVWIQSHRGVINLLLGMLRECK